MINNKISRIVVVKDEKPLRIITGQIQCHCLLHKGIKEVSSNRYSGRKRISSLLPILFLYDVADAYDIGTKETGDVAIGFKPK
jgi:hypothetical protein